MATQVTDETAVKKSPLQEIVQPFVDLVHAPRALFGVNLAYVIEGMVYFGILGYLSLYFSDFVFRGVDGANDLAHKAVMVLTAGITLSMVFFGSVADKWGPRRALLTALLLMVIGRAVISSGPTVFGLQPAGVWSSLLAVTMVGILVIVIGYGMFQPAAYAAVRRYTTPKTSGMYFVMLYAVMNLGGWFPTFAFLLRDDDYLGLGIPGVFWIYTGFTAAALLCTWLILSRRTEQATIARAAAETEREEGGSARRPASGTATAQGKSEHVNSGRSAIPLHLLVLAVAVAIAAIFSFPKPWSWLVAAIVVLGTMVAALIPQTARWVARHPLAELKFFFFIFALIPVQTLFTYNWFVLPAYIERSYAGWIGEYFEIFSNQNPLLVFVLAPIIAAFTQKRRIYDLMLIGTLVMAAPAFLLAFGTNPVMLIGYIVIMTIGEVTWQPRFLQYAAQIAPEGQTGRYVGVAQLPWFLTKVLVPMLYSGKMMDRFCPAEGPKDPQTMWLIFACIAMVTPVLLLLGKRWIGKDYRPQGT